MAINLIKHGYSLLAYDINATTVDYVAAQGAEKADCLAKVAEQAEAILTMLLN